MIFNPCWDYKEMIKNLKTLRLHYEEVLTSFSYIKDENDYIKTSRNNLYSTNLQEFQKDRIWEYINKDLTSVEIFLFFGFLEFEEENRF